MRRALLAVGALLIAADLSWAETKVVCTIAVSAKSGEPVVDDGDCGRRMSPASTFKVAISLMGFDAGILKSPGEPELPFEPGYADWRPEWRQPTTPASWMRDSVVWYSQQITQRLGTGRFASYAAAFDYGNRDLSGDPGKDNGLTNAWLSSSLQISPREQVTFLRRLVSGELQVSAAAFRNTRTIMDYGTTPGGWQLFGKTGSGSSRSAGGARKPFGWFVGWAERGGETVVYARLIEDDRRQSVSPGFRARDGLIEDLFSKDGALR